MERQKVRDKIAGNRCSVLNCRKSKRDIPGLRLFAVPKRNTYLRSFWVFKCGLNDVGRNLYVCERHFNKSLIGIKCLQRGAIPSLFLPSCTSQNQYFPLLPKLSENDPDEFADELPTNSGIIVKSQSSIRGNHQTEDPDKDKEEDPDVPKINETKVKRPKNLNLNLGIDEKSIKIKVTTMISKRIMELDKLLKNVLRNNVSIEEQQLLLQYNKRPDFPSLQWFEPKSNSTTDLEQTCRVCVRLMTKNEKRVSLFPDTTGNNLNTDFRELNNMNLRIYRDDGLPQNICAPCATRLEHLNDFHLHAVRAQYILQAYFDRIVKTNDLDDTLDPNDYTGDIGIEFLKVEPIEILDSYELDQPLENMEYGINKFVYQSYKDNDSNDNIVNSVNDLKLKCIDCEETFNETRKLLDHRKMCKKPKSEPAPQPTISAPIDLVDEQRNDNASCSNEVNSIQSTESIAYASKKKRAKGAGRRRKIRNDPISNYRFTRRCNICRTRFSSYAKRTEHMLIHNEGNHQCLKCDCNFEIKSDLTVHYNEVHPLICPICNRIFKRRIQLRRHLRVHNAPRKYKCQYCDKTFKREHHVRNHEATHTGARNFLCEKCGKSFTNEGSLSGHRKLCDPSHKLYNSIGCDHCGKLFASKSMLIHHVRTHTGEKPFVCDLCDKRFIQKATLKLHIIRNHVQIYKWSEEGTIKSMTIAAQQFLYKCDICNKRFRYQSTLTKHLKRHTNEEKRKYVCQTCKQTFKRYAHLRIHIDCVHLRLKRYKCDICEKTFHHRGNLNSHHHDMHWMGCKYECFHCGKKFQRRSGIRQHMKIHTGEKPYRCYTCGARFALYVHMTIHVTKKGGMCTASI